MLFKWKSRPDIVEVGVTEIGAGIAIAGLITQRRSAIWRGAATWFSMVCLSVDTRT
jgi:hypothetical protein